MYWQALVVDERVGGQGRHIFTIIVEAVVDRSAADAQIRPLKRRLQSEGRMDLNIDRWRAATYRPSYFFYWYTVRVAK